jgi:hypothetical protein
MAAITISKQFKKMDNIKYSLITIKPDKCWFLYNTKYYTKLD